MEKGNSAIFIVLISVVAFLSLALAVLAGYFFVVVGNPNTNNTLSQDKNALEQEKKVDKTEVEKFELFEKKYFVLKRDEGESKSSSIIQVGAILVYAKDKNEKKNNEILISNKEEIVEILSIYFQGLTLADVRPPENRDKVKKELTGKINEFLRGRAHKLTILDVVFTDWMPQ